MSVLVVGAEPDRLPKFDCAQRLTDLANSLPANIDLHVCSPEGVKKVEGRFDAKDWEPFIHPTRDALKAALAAR